MIILVFFHILSAAFTYPLIAFPLVLVNLEKDNPFKILDCPFNNAIRLFFRAS